MKEIIRKYHLNMTESIAFQQNRITSMKERAHRKQIQRALSHYSPSTYSKALSKYLKTTAKIVDPLLMAISDHSPIAHLFPLYQLIRATARLFLLSQIEILLFAYQLQESKWRTDNRVILQRSGQMGELICCSKEGDYRRVALYLILTGYWAKSSLNQDCECFLDEMKKICTNFKEIFEEWAGGHTLQLSIPPKQLNRLYCLIRSGIFSPHHHYNFIVDQIIQLSHPYNLDKQSNHSRNSPQSFHSFSILSLPNESRPPHKFIKPQLQFLPPDLTQIESQENESHFQSINPFGSHSIGKTQKINNFFDVSSSLNNSLPSLLLSVPSLSLQHSVKHEGDCNYIEVGFCQGESAQLMVLGQTVGGSLLADREILGQADGAQKEKKHSKMDASLNI